jgi:hypothetical protein
LLVSVPASLAGTSENILIIDQANTDSDDDDNGDDNNNSNSNNSVKTFVIYVPSQQLQGQLQKQPSVDTGNLITDKQKHEDNSHMSN